MALWTTAMNWPQTAEGIGLPYVQPDVWEADCFARKVVRGKIGKSFHRTFSEGNSFPRNALRAFEKVPQFHRFTGLEWIAGLGMERANTTLSFIFRLQKKNI